MLPPARRPHVVGVLLSAVGLSALALLTGITAHAQNRREFAVSAHKYGFSVTGAGAAEIRVQQDDLVRITFSAEDIPHSFTTVEDDPHYRINRRAEPGKPVTFEFRADKPGKFPIKCTLAIDDKCRE